MPYLVHLYNGAPINHFYFDDVLTIGRKENNDIQIDDPTLSANHAVVERYREDAYRIRDLDSTNGVLYKGRKVLSHRLLDGDVVVLGTHDVKFVYGLPDQSDKTRKIKKSWIPGVYYTDD